MALMNFLKPYLARVVCTLLGLIIAILFLTLGFGKTLLILFCCGIGYAIGTYKDKGLQFPERLNFRRNKW